MTRRTLAAVLLAAAGITASASMLSAKPPTDEQVSAAAESMKSAVAEMRKAGPFDETKYKAAANAALEGLDVSEMTLAQLKTLRQAISPSEQAGKAGERLEELAASPDRAGAEAAIMRLDFMDAKETPAAAQAGAIRTALDHPALVEALKEREGAMLFWQIRGASPEAKKLIVGDLARLEGIVSDDLPAGTLRAMTELFGAFSEAGPEHLAARERLRVKLLKTATAASAEESAADAKSMKALAEYLDGAYARGQLVDHSAPAMTIAWSSDPKISSFADLKGKVVVLDFWATWCGPCIASFPNVRELVEHYKGYDVAVVGVTSVQGYHIGPDGKVDTKGDPGKEFGLMPAFMAQKEMTWPVVFTDEPVFNIDFGVTGIPHVAIIDPAGKVRYNGLHPGGEVAPKIEKIDALLKEAGLPTPSAE